MIILKKGLIVLSHQCWLLRTINKMKRIPWSHGSSLNSRCHCQHPDNWSRWSYNTSYGGPDCSAEHSNNKFLNSNCTYLVVPDICMPVVQTHPKWSPYSVSRRSVALEMLQRTEHKLRIRQTILQRPLWLSRLLWLVNHSKCWHEINPLMKA